MPRSAPTSNGGLLANQFRRFRWQAHGQYVLLEIYVTLQFDKSHVILKIGRRIVRMHFLSFDAVLFVMESFVLIAYIPFAQSHFHIRIWRGGNAMCCRHNPSIRHERTAATQFARQKARFNQCRLPRMASERCRMAANNTIRTSEQFTAA